MKIDATVANKRDLYDSELEPILYWDKEGRFTPYSTEEILANHLNGFKNWTCTAGMNSLFIHFEGIVFRGTCMVGGSNGNIYDAGFEFPTSNVLCPKEYCMCGADMMVPKFKTAAGPELQFKLQKSESRTLDPIAVTGSEILRSRKTSEQSFVKRVIWSLGKRCNYDCSYCTPDVHSSTEPLKSKESLLSAAEKLVIGFCKGERTIFYIAGGEPTLYPGLVDLTKYLFEQGHECVVVSNGSTKADIYEKLIQYSHVCLSAHFEFLREERFLDNIRRMTNSLCRTKYSSRGLNHRVDVKLMTKPGQFSQSIDLAKKINAIFGFRFHGTIRFNPLWHPDNPEKLLEYSEQDHEQFVFLNRQKTQDSIIRQKPLVYFYGALRNGQHKIFLMVLQAALFENRLIWTIHSLWSKLLGNSKRIGIEIWNSIYYNRFLRKLFHSTIYFLQNPKEVLEELMVNVWNLFYYNRILRKPYYFIKFQYEKRFKKSIGN